MAMPPNVYGMHFTPVELRAEASERHSGGLEAVELKAMACSHPTPADARRLAATWTGEPVIYPAGAVPMRSVVILPPGKQLPPHLHPYPRIAEVQSGRIRVVQEAQGAEPERSREFEAGDTIVETVGRYHFGRSIGQEPARLIVYDYLPSGVESNTVYRQLPTAPRR